jgi:hypothetical protein
LDPWWCRVWSLGGEELMERVRKGIRSQHDDYSGGGWGVYRPLWDKI